MLFVNKNTTLCIAIFSTIRVVLAEGPYFRVLAPEFVCPNDNESLIKPPDYTVVTIKTDAPQLKFSWMVRWSPLKNPSQRRTLMLWKTIRALEAKMNGPQPEPFVYVINNAELLDGIEYVFNVTANEPGSDNTTSKGFQIDNIKGDQKLLIEGRADKISLLLIGNTDVYADMEYVIEAEVTTCTPIQDYYFQWRVEGTSSGPTPTTTGSRLQLPPHSLIAGERYDVQCSLYRSNNDFVTQTGLPVQVLYRGLGLSLNSDEIIVTVNNGITIEAIVTNFDYNGEDVQLEWSCVFDKEPCKTFSSIDSNILSLPDGLPNLGMYEIIATASVLDQQATAILTVKTVEAVLPDIQIKPLPRINNENSVITLSANASNVTPSCTLTWYFATIPYSANSNTSCEDCEGQHGEPLSETVTIQSLEENFLNELTDFTNETASRQVTVQMVAAAGRARFVVKCGCSLTFNCNSQGEVYADILFGLNYAPIVHEIKVTPESGTAMETVFRLSTLAASDNDRPLLYSFYCSLGGNDTILLGSNLEHLAVETFLPYVDANGTNIWVEACDSLGACSSSEQLVLELDPGNGRTVDALVDSIRGHGARCEIMMLNRLVKASVATYVNAKQDEVLSLFSSYLLEILPTPEGNPCTQDNHTYSDLVQWLIATGVDVSSLFE